MRLLLISPYFPPQRGAASIRLWALARQACAAGIEVDVLTTAKHPDQTIEWEGEFSGAVHEIEYQVPKILRSLRKVHKQEEDVVHGGVADAGSGVGRLIKGTLGRVRAKTGVYSSVRMPDLTDYWVGPAIEWACEHQKTAAPWDVVVSSSGPYTAHLAAMGIKKRGLARAWVAEFRDLWTANQPFKGCFPMTLREGQLENRVLRSADGLATVSRPMGDWLGARSNASVEVIYNGYNELNDECLTSKLSRKPSGLGEPIRLVFTGRIYPGNQCPRAILSALATLRKEGVDITLTVAGSSCDLWERHAQELGALDGLELLGVVTHMRAIELQRSASALVAIEWSDPKAGVLSSKLFEYIAAGPMVLLTGPGGGAMGEMLSQTGRGLHLGKSSELVEQSLRSLIAGECAFPEPIASEIEQLSRSAQSQRMIEFCQRIAHSAPD